MANCLAVRKQVQRATLAVMGAVICAASAIPIEAQAETP